MSSNQWQDFKNLYWLAAVEFLILPITMLLNGKQNFHFKLQLYF